MGIEVISSSVFIMPIKNNGKNPLGKNRDSACPLTCLRYQNKQVTAGFEPRTRASKPLALSPAQVPLWVVNQDLPRSLLGMGLTSLRCESPQRGLFVGESFGDTGRKEDYWESIWISKDNE